MPMCPTCKQVFEYIDWQAKEYCSVPCAMRARSQRYHPNLKPHWFDELDSVEKAYWLGFLLGDGSMELAPRGGARLVLQLHQRDEDQLDRFIAAVGANAGRKQRYEGFVGIRLGQRDLTAALQKWGVAPGKTRQLRLPSLAKSSLDDAVLLGLFDADGSADRTHSPTLTSGSRGCLEQIVDRYGLRFQPVLFTRGNSHYWQLNLGRKLFRQLLAVFPGSMPRKRVPYSGASKEAPP